MIFVSHDRYFVDKLATKVVEIGGGQALLYPGTYEEFLWSRRQQSAPRRRPLCPKPRRRHRRRSGAAAEKRAAAAARNGNRASRGQKRRRTRRPRSSHTTSGAGTRRRRAAYSKAADSLRRRIDELEARIADREKAIKEIEASMSAPGFYDNRDASRPIIDRHQALMWEVGDLMNQWEALQTKS